MFPLFICVKVLIAKGMLVLYSPSENNYYIAEQLETPQHALLLETIADDEYQKIKNTFPELYEILILDKKDKPARRKKCFLRCKL